MTPSNRGAQGEITAPRWRGLYRAGGAAALIAALLFRRNLGAEFWLLRNMGLIGFGPKTIPSSAPDWFALLQDSPFLGLTLLNLFDLVNYALVGLIFLALYGALRRVDQSAMLIATTFGFVGIAVCLSSNQAFAMLALSEQYVAATTEAQRSICLAAGQALLAIDNPGTIHNGTGIYVSLLLVTLAGLIISIVMLRSRVFGRATAYIGILAHAFGLGYFVALVLAPAIVFLPPSLSALFLLAWYIRIGLRLLQLGSSTLEKAAHARSSES